MALVPVASVSGRVRRALSLCCFAVLPWVISGAEEVSELWREYEKAPDTHPWIPNGSYAGFRYGEEPIPDVAGPLFNVREFGAVGDGKADDTNAIRAALAAVGADGGVVWLPDGDYAVGGVLFVHTNRTVIRGESREGARIVFTQPLERGFGRLDSITPRGERISRWSYSGGLVWFTPSARGVTYRRDAEPDSPLRPGEFSEAWLTDGELGAVAAVAERGDRTVTLDREAEVEVGEFVLLEQSDPGDYSLMKHLAGGGEWAEAYRWKDGLRGAAWAKPGPLRWVVEVAAVSGRVVTFRQPLRFEARPNWSAKLHRMGPLLRESGIENLTLVFNRTYTWDYAMHHREEGWNAPYFNNAVNCWLRGVTMVDMDSGPNLSCAKLVTLTDFTLKASRPELMAHHHGTITRAGSHDNLFSDFRFESQPWHGANVESLSTGNVWTRGHLEHGTFDSHRRMPFENLRSDITLAANDGTHGGNGGPLMGARFANWNIRTPSGRNYIVGWANATPHGVIVGLQGSEPRWDAQHDRTPTGEIACCRVEATGRAPSPANLYEAQLRLRLQTSPKE